jgi:HEAT repeat protein
MQVLEELMATILDELRDRGAEIGVRQAREAWMSSVEKLETLEMTDRDVLRMALKSGGATEVSLACWALGGLRDESAVEDLLKVLRRGDRHAFEAAKAIRVIGSLDAVNPLIEVLVSDAAVAIRTAAAYSLAGFKQAEVEAALCDVLRAEDEPAQVRAACAEAMGYGQFGGAVSALVDAARDASPDVRFWSIYALGEIGDPVALPAVSARLNDRDQVSTGELVCTEAARVREVLTQRAGG